MNALTLARSAYRSAQSPVRTARSTEYEAFARITSRMKKAASLGRSGFAALAEAIHDNRKLWAALASDVADAQNGLPQDLRARIFYLAEFTSHHSSLVLKRQADPNPLIEINTAIMRGLRSATVTS